jgi:hypothetical protein
MPYLSSNGKYEISERAEKKQTKVEKHFHIQKIVKKHSKPKMIVKILNHSLKQHLKGIPIFFLLAWCVFPDDVDLFAKAVFICVYVHIPQKYVCMAKFRITISITTNVRFCDMRSLHKTSRKFDFIPTGWQEQQQFSTREPIIITANGVYM